MDAVSLIEVMRYVLDLGLMQSVYAVVPFLDCRVQTADSRTKVRLVECSHRRVSRRGPDEGDYFKRSVCEHPRS